MAEYISKEKAINALLNKGQRSKRYKLGETWELNLMEITEAINSISPEDVQPVKHGKWLLRCEGDIYDFSECSECGNTESCETPYCAQCGARMDGDTE